MNKTNKKKMLLVCLLIAVIGLIYEILHIYAVFHSEMTGNLEFANGRWNILVNGSEISEGVSVSFVIDQVTAEGNSHVKPGNLAPRIISRFRNNNKSTRYRCICKI